MKHPIHSPGKSVKIGIVGFTLIELLTVMAVVGVLAAILIVGVSKVRDSAKGAKSISNLRQINQLHLVYMQDNKGNMLTYAPMSEVGIAAAWPLHLAKIAGINQSVSDPEIVTCEGTIFASPFVEFEQRLDSTPGYGWNPNLGWNLSAYEAEHVKYLMVDEPAQTIAFGESYHGNRPDDLYTHYIVQPDANVYPVNERNGQVVLGWLDGRVSQEDVEILSREKNNIPYYFWKLEKYSN